MLANISDARPARRLPALAPPEALKTILKIKQLEQR
jgi:hypothetical protein